MICIKNHKVPTALKANTPAAKVRVQEALRAQTDQYLYREEDWVWWLWGPEAAMEEHLTWLKVSAGIGEKVKYILCVHLSTSYMSICVHMCMCAREYVEGYTCMCARVYVCTCVCGGVYMHVCTCICGEDMCTCVCGGAYMYVCMCVCGGYICMCMWRVYMYVCTRVCEGVYL